MKVGDKVKMSHPGKRDGAVGTIVKLDVPLDSHSCNPCKCGAQINIEGEDWSIHKNFISPVMTTFRSCEFIESINIDVLGNKIESVFVPKPTSVFGGWARHQWLKRYFKKECSITSPGFWKVLIERHGKPKTLIEEDGVFRVKENEE